MAVRPVVQVTAAVMVLDPERSQRTFKHKRSRIVNVPNGQDSDNAAEQEPVQEHAVALIEDVSIDGMCGVY